MIFKRKRIGPVKQVNLLELACGAGSAIPLLERFNAYTGLDLSLAMLKRAPKKSGQKGVQAG